MGLSARLVRPSLGSACGTFVVASGVAIGLRSLNDNSFLTHLATGRLILDSGGIPRVDPYTFTAEGTSWLVQSWLASVLYATAERLGGLEAVRLLMGVVAGLLAGAAWTLTRRADGLLVRFGLAALSIAVAAGLWAERPFMLGLLAMVAYVLVAEGRLDARWLIPVGWLWVNTHGSFPLGLVYLAVVVVGERLDGRSWSRLPAVGWAAAGVLAGAVGPLGPKILLFPLDLLGRQELLRNVTEWQSPGFTTFSQRAFLVQLIVMIVLLARRPSYRASLVTAVFVAAALLGARNLVVASLVLLPEMARSAPAVGGLRWADRPRAAPALAAIGLALIVVVTASRTSEPALRLTRYPVDSLAYLEANGVDTRAHRLAAPDIVGNLMDYVYGPDGRVFYDDRFDMYPDEVSDAHLALVRAGPSLQSELRTWDIELVVTPQGGAPSALLTVDPEWRLLFADERWTLLCRRGVDLGGAVGGC